MSVAPAAASCAPPKPDTVTDGSSVRMALTRAPAYRSPDASPQETRTRRPLTPEQLQYAEDDVRYLVPLYLDLRKALEAAGRLDWLYEETRELEQLRQLNTELLRHVEAERIKREKRRMRVQKEIEIRASEP